MKHFQALWEEVKKLSDNEVPFTPSFGAKADLDIDLTLSEGRAVDIGEVKSRGGVLVYEGRHVLLYIPDQGSSVGDVLNGNLNAGKKVHLADCEVLGRMRSAGRFERYIATTRIDGIFHVVGHDYKSGRQIEGLTPLFVCMPCLSQLNYKGAARSGKERRLVRDSFDFAEFFETYSTLFQHKPRRSSVDPSAFRYPDNWGEVSDNYRASVGWKCEQCLIDLSDNRPLLHTHHRNGNRGDCSRENLQALCVDCHRRQPYHGRVHVSPTDMEIIARKRLGFRRTYSTWKEALDCTDLALHGALEIARQRRWNAPRPGGAPGMDDPIGVHWPDRRVALSLPREGARAPEGWKVLDAASFIARFGQ